MKQVIPSGTLASIQAAINIAGPDELGLLNGADVVADADRLGGGAVFDDGDDKTPPFAGDILDPESGSCGVSRWFKRPDGGPPPATRR